jgi:hypothetical protein
MSLESKITGAVLVGAIGGIFYFSLIKPRTENNTFNRVYENALIQYADVDENGFISSDEQDAFDADLLKDKKVTLVSGRFPKYQDGRQVPVPVLTEWVKNYKPSE